MAGMGRKRTRDKHLPRGVTHEHGAYYFRGADRKRIHLGCDFADAMTRYGDMFRQAPLSTFGAVLDRYLQQVTPKKAPRTQTDETKYIATIRSVFGLMTPKAITPSQIYEFRDKIAVKSGDVQANHHLKTLKHVCVKAVEWGAVIANPARDVSKLHVRPRDRYAEDWEYEAVYKCASEVVRVAMDLAVLTGMRRGDLLALTRSQLRDDGIHVTTGKTGRKLIIEWSDELRDVVARAKQLKPQVRQHVIATRQGKRFTANGFSTLWQRAVRKALKQKALTQRFTFNDLRSKSASDTADLLEASERLGHSSPAITKQVYRRKPVRVTPLR